MDRASDRMRDFSSAAVLILLLLVSSQRLYSTGWTSGLGVVLLLTLLGAVLGLALGLSIFKRPVILILALGYSILLIPLVTVWDLYKNVAWLERVVSLGRQLAYSFVQLVTSQPVRDSTLFIVFVSVVFWIISLMAGFTLTRSGGFAGAVVPAGVVLVIIQLFDQRAADRVYVLAIYVFLGLLLLGRLTYLRKRNFWKGTHVWVSGESITDLNIIVGVTALVLVVLVWAVPVSGRPLTSARIMWENLTRPWRDRRQQLSHAVESLQGGQPNAAEIYGDTLGLGREAQTGNEPYLSIRAPLVNGAERYYWRVRTYDFYWDDQWYTNYAYDEPFTPGQSSLSLADPEGVAGEFAFIAPNDNLAMLATPPRPIWINRPSQMTFTPSIDGRIDPLMFVADPALLAGEEYIVHANIYEPTEFQLRNAGVDYPAWVRDHYLELPGNLPSEIDRLAQQITAGSETPYDKAVAITGYLRTNIAYSTTVENPPAGRDMLVWFLFDTKKGFCNYYATAEVVLLRSVGVPARMAVGYAQGEYNPPDQYTVRKKDAHAWPEVYFPGSGWVQFEPTSNQSPLVRPASGNLSTSQAFAPTPQGIPQSNNAHQTPIPIGEGETSHGSGTPPNTLLRLTILFLVSCILIIAGAVAYSFGAFDKLIAAARRAFQSPAPVLLKNSLENLALTPPNWLVRWAYFAGLSPTGRYFAVVYRSLRWLGEKSSVSRTPAEAAAALIGYIPKASKEIHILLEECQNSLYGQKPGNLTVAHRAADTIWRVSLRAAIRARWRAFEVIFERGFRRKKTP